jgi:hypothetical protein
VSNLRNFVGDDENDTLAFKRWEDHVLKNHPNPQRIGCPDHDVLRIFVETPRKIGLSELHGDHITRCAECVRDLIELRRTREERLQHHASSSTLGSWWGWRTAVALASLCVIIVIGAIVWRDQAREPRRSTQQDEITEITLDLSGDGVTRGIEAQTGRKPLSLPRRLVSLHLILPYYSPAGEYRIAIARDRNSVPVLSESATATSQGPRTELRIQLDLRNLTAGSYYLGTAQDGESTTYFYPFTIG